MSETGTMFPCCPHCEWCDRGHPKACDHGCNDKESGDD